jgi:hypothetical protein
MYAAIEINETAAGTLATALPFRLAGLLPFWAPEVNSGPRQEAVNARPACVCLPG